MLFVLLRAGVTLFFVLTAAYAVVSYSPFAFDMFIRPQLVPWVSDFVAWHHVWYLAAYLLSVVTLRRELLPAAGDRRRRIARGLAAAYVVIFGAVAVRLVQSPYLPSLWNDNRTLVAAVAAMVPLVWLSVIDHLAAPVSTTADDDGTATYTQLVVAAGMCGLYIWAIHLARAWLTGSSDGTAAAWAVTAAWTLTVTLTLSLLGYAAFAVVHAVATEALRRPALEHLLGVALMAVAGAEFLRRLVLPTIALDGEAAALIAYVAAGTLAAVWSGLAARGQAGRATPSVLHTLFPVRIPAAAAAAALVALPIASFAASSYLQALDWMRVMQRLVIVVESLIAFACLLGMARAWPRPGFHRAAVPAALVLCVAGLTGLPRAATALAASSGDARLRPAVLLERHAAAEPALALMSDAIVAAAGHDSEYYRYLQVTAASTGAGRVPDLPTSLSGESRPEAAPDIFLFVVDSLRRDYLSPYNRAVTFTPNIERLAAESLVFENAFTRHGGTELSMVSIWTGLFAVRGIRTAGFERVNALEKLMRAERYRIAINDHTVASLLRPGSDVTFIDPEVPSVETDLCRNLAGLEQYLDASAGDRRPVFGYFAPMNVHLLNTRPAGLAPAGDARYGAFYAPYASRLERIDACLGDFLRYLEARDRDDNAVVIVTSDHGDSLGERGYWGHAHWIFPEGIRVPLIVRLPPRLRQTHTTDLARVAFTSDIAPTLYTLLGHDVQERGPLYGSPLIVPVDRALASRRRAAYLITSSYSPTYAVLRRNGTFLYVTDLFEKQEFAFAVHGPAAAEVPVTRPVRQANQQLIRGKLAEVGRFYGNALSGAGSAATILGNPR